MMSRAYNKAFPYMLSLLYYSFLENIGSLTMQGHQLVRKDHRYSLEGLNCKKICSTLNRCT